MKKKRAYRLRRSYRLTAENWKAILRLQGGGRCPTGQIVNKLIVLGRKSLEVRHPVAPETIDANLLRGLAILEGRNGHVAIR